MSTLAIYGDAGDAILDDAVPADGPPQMAGVAKALHALLGRDEKSQVVGGVVWRLAVQKAELPDGPTFP